MNTKEVLLINKCQRRTIERLKLAHAHTQNRESFQWYHTIKYTARKSNKSLSAIASLESLSVFIVVIIFRFIEISSTMKLVSIAMAWIFHFNAKHKKVIYSRTQTDRRNGNAFHNRNDSQTTVVFRNIIMQLIA